MRSIYFIFEVSAGFVLGQLLWEVLLAIAAWAGRLSVKLVAGVLRHVGQANSEVRS